MSLHTIALEMKEFALATPYNIEVHQVPHPSCSRRVEFDGDNYQITLTYNIYDSKPLRFWQAAVEILEAKPLPDEATFEIARELLGDQVEEIEFPPWFLATLDSAIREAIMGGHRKLFKAIA